MKKLNKKKNSELFFLKITFKIAMFCAFFIGMGNTKVTAQEQDTSNQNYFDTSNIGTIDTTATNVFESDYNVTLIQKLDETVIDLNQLLGIEQLKVGTKYNVSLTFQNPFQFDIIIKKTLTSCMCINVNYSNTPIQIGTSTTINFAVFPTTEGYKSVTINYLIGKAPLPLKPKPLIIVGDKPTKITFTAVAN